MNDRVVVGTFLSEDTRFTLVEVCERCGTSRETVVSVVEEGLVQPQGKSPEEWSFDLVALQRTRRALRLQREFDIELSGIALMLDLFDELGRLRRQLALLEHQLKR